MAAVLWLLPESDELLGVGLTEDVIVTLSGWVEAAADSSVSWDGWPELVLDAPSSET
jgi:hypothetical protein